ncbi:MAG: insulinase family protein [Spirochaetaceae bacterium]|jgi:Zn-dependent M16 (insulinase) family peptidase|nr:insulinase family protein [Spirochaetaceae bacterium]
MKTSLRPGAVLESGFAILDVVDLTELKAQGIWARHQASGLEVFHVWYDDPENLFAFAFATTPEDSTGVAHILEHSVLCGSVRYPLKDAFLVLAQGSLQTYLNAWTFPDKTVYPASSINEHDYYNLMAVYGDAVFRPLLSEWTFMQEGHRFEWTSGDAGQEQLSLTGVVYNEMKGAYSSLDAYASLWSTKAVLPDTPYRFESGGDPECIPSLTWEGLRDFHRTRYVPGNCRVFLAGNIPTEKQLAFLQQQVLAGLEPGKAAPTIPRSKPWNAPQYIRVPGPAGAEQKATVLLSWLCGDSLDTRTTMDLCALTEVLLGHDGSPLTRVLIESGFGEDLSPVTGLDGELRERVFTVGLRGIAPELPGARAGTEVEALILKELRRLAAQGISPKDVEAALLSLEFSHREIRRAHGPYSLVWLQRSLGAWIHGALPWESLLFLPEFTALKTRIAQAAAEGRPYFESLIQRYLLDNPHRACVVIEPKQGFLEEKEAILAAELAKTQAALGEEEKSRIREKGDELTRIQGEGEDPEALARIPHLAREDLSPALEPIPREYADAGGVPALTHDLFTNGITYVDLAFPVDVLEPEDYPWLPLFAVVSLSLGLPGMDYGAVASLRARILGDLHGSLQISNPVPGISRTMPTPAGIFDLAGRDWLVYRLKALDEKIEPALDLTRRLITEGDFSDLRRIRDLILEFKNNLDSSLAPMGHRYAVMRSERFCSRTRAVEELWSGLSQIQWIHTLAASEDETLAALTRIRDTLVARAGLMVNITGSTSALALAHRAVERHFSDFGPPRFRNPQASRSEPFFALLGDPGTGAAEVYASPSLQVGFAALSVPGAAFGTKESAVESVLAHGLSTGALWEDIRMKGGAYGAYAQPDSLEQLFSMVTYRDPNPLRSLEAFTAILRDRVGPLFKGEFLEKAVIGTYGKKIQPRVSAEKGFLDFFRYLYGIPPDHPSRSIAQVLEVSPQEIVQAARRLVPSGASSSRAVPLILSGTKTAETAAARLGVPVQSVPV